MSRYFRTPAPSPSPRPSPLGRGSHVWPCFGCCKRVALFLLSDWPSDRTAVPPLPKGEGRGEGEGNVCKPGLDHIAKLCCQSTYFFALLLICTFARISTAQTPTFAGGVVVGTISAWQIWEASGLVASR